MMKITERTAKEMVKQFETDHPKLKVYNLKRVSFSNFVAYIKDYRHPELKDDTVRIEWDGIKLMR